MIQSTDSKTVSSKEFIQRLLVSFFRADESFAIWRKPKSSILEVIHSPQEEVQKVPLDLENLPAGFIIHPFLDQKDGQAFFIEADNYFRFDLKRDIEVEELPVRFQQILLENKASDSPYKVFRKTQTGMGSPAQDHRSEEQQHFEMLVKKGVQGIEEKRFEKVVPARTKTVTLPVDFDLAKSLQNMLGKYPNAFVNFFHLKGIATWLGASPEVLIETKGDQFYTMSLAGTQPADGENPIKSVAWTQKEIEEQALVSRYIVDCFKKIRLREYEEHGPKTVQAGTLLHLRSDFHVNMKDTNFPQLGSVMLKLLHPTSAVCGMPRQAALDFLEQHEGFDRSFFAGFLGTVNLNSETSIYVNLRTASLQGDKAIIYAGAGVTEDSDPLKEWEETEMKCANIGRILQNEDL
ncbi:chorismate-binding protein [Algoriphagus namhaensis]